MFQRTKINKERAIEQEDTVCSSESMNNNNRIFRSKGSTSHIEEPQENQSNLDTLKQATRLIHHQESYAEAGPLVPVYRGALHHLTVSVGTFTDSVGT